MTQTAHNGEIELVTDTWTLISEINCTWQALSALELICMDGAAPADDDVGLFIARHEGRGKDEDTFALFPGAGTPDRIYVRSKGKPGSVFVSRAAVA